MFHSIRPLLRWVIFPEGASMAGAVQPARDRPK
jgi:hypothetical protein